MSGAARRLALVFAVAVSLPVALLALALVVAPGPILEAGREEMSHRERFREMVATPGREGLPVVLFLGDSTFGRSYPRFVGRQLAGRVDARIYWAAGIGPFQHYALLTRAISLEPAAVVLLAHLRIMVLDAPPLPRQELLAEMPPAALPRALALPYYARGIGAARLLMDSAAGALVPMSAYRVMRGVLAFARDTPPLSWLVPQGWRIGRPEQRGAIGRENFRRYGHPLSVDDPSVEMLLASVELARRHGARTLVVVSPIPVDELREAGLYDADEFAARIEALRERVEAGGGELLDLHRLLLPVQFNDRFGHYDHSGAASVGAHVLRWLLDTLDLPPAPDPGPGRRRS